MIGKLYAAAALALPIAAGGIVAASASSDPGDRDGHGGRVIELTTQQVNQDYVDLGAAGFSTSDQFVFTNDLKRDGQKVGEDGGTCTVTRVPAEGDPTLQCLGTNSLPGGQISVQGLAAPGKPFVLGITGGTGRYSDAQGQVFGENTSPTTMRIRIVLK
jgi:hypothetical protein